MDKKPFPQGSFFAINKTQLLQLALTLCLLLLATGCGPRGHACSSGFTKESAYSLFTSSFGKETVFIICVQTPPHQPRCSFGADIYGGGYFHLDSGRKIQFFMPDSQTVVIDNHSVKLTDGQLIKAVIENGVMRFEQESLDTALAREILSH